MRRPEKPSMAFTDSLRDARTRIISKVVAVMCPTERRAKKDCDGLFDLIQAAERRVQGNRNDNTAPNWEDMRLMLVNDLKILLDYLDPQ